MSDAKKLYSKTVEQMRLEAEKDSVLERKISKGFERKMQYRDNWEAVDINEFVNKHIGNDCTIVRRNNKLCYINKEQTLAVVADIGGTYCRLQDWALFLETGKEVYFDINGNLPYNYKDERGKIHGRSKKEQNKITHFRIKRLDEMNNGVNNGIL